MELPFTQSTCIPLEMLECDKLTIPQSFICPLNKNLIQDPVNHHLDYSNNNNIGFR